jgi:hypothetical protein
LVEIHCHVCGGFISDRKLIAYRMPSDAATASPRSALCDCGQPILYGAPPGHMSSPGMPAIARVPR